MPTTGAGFRVQLERLGRWRYSLGFTFAFE